MQLLIAFKEETRTDALCCCQQRQQQQQQCIADTAGHILQLPVHPRYCCLYTPNTAAYTPQAQLPVHPKSNSCPYTRNTAACTLQPQLLPIHPNRSCCLYTPAAAAAGAYTPQEELPIHLNYSPMAKVYESNEEAAELLGLAYQRIGDR